MYIFLWIHKFSQEHIQVAGIQVKKQNIPSTLEAPSRLPPAPPLLKINLYPDF